MSDPSLLAPSSMTPSRTSGSWRGQAWARLERMSRGRLTRDGLEAAAAQLFPLAFILVLAYAAVQIEAGNIAAGVFGFDFRGTLWDPARAIADGVSPYPPPVDSAVATGNPALYPPLAPLVLVPLGFLPWELALTVWTTVLVLAVIVAVRLVGVRDWRCYAYALLCPLVADGLIFGNLVILLLVGVCAAWRWRDRPVVVGIAVGLTVAAKIVTWPLLVWLLVTRRLRGLAWAGGTTATAIVVPWALIGFRGLADYPSLLRAADRVYGPHGFSLAATADALGASELRSLAYLGAAVLALVACAASRRDFDAYAFSILAVVLVSPIAWPYSFVLLLAPVAAARTRLSYAWVALPVLLVAAAAVPHPTSPVAACCRPVRTPVGVWEFLHVPPSVWRPPAFAIAAALTVLAATRVARRRAS